MAGSRGGASSHQPVAPISRRVDGESPISDESIPPRDSRLGRATAWAWSIALGLWFLAFVLPTGRSVDDSGACTSDIVTGPNFKAWGYGLAALGFLVAAAVSFSLAGERRRGRWAVLGVVAIGLALLSFILIALSRLQSHAFC